ncbi:hypothetical protein KIH86_02765 [Paenibacillus sp. HN-1]|uniref:TolB family protein n=1 Tax=Paenibacillus TaxID=44249 RepID=UPI001CA94B20|nr:MULTISPECIES: hypothetical protein [Paenibacillus]MBY9078341.1 hypothetical protein [Paenibacillus sp. CGMCC 1.18879]MBY9083153.1 hypothetical protein [Paenibacillus sinensis]
MKNQGDKAHINPFYAIYHEYISLPEGVMPWAPTWSPDGEHILFHDYNGGYEWVVNADGSQLKCITNEMKDRPNILGAFSYIFPDNKRLFLSDELGDQAYILECEPDLYNCTAYQWFKIDLSGDQVPGKPIIGRRTYHLAPDGIHLAYNAVRPDGLIMLVCKLERTDEKYVATEYRVVNPPGPKGPDDTNPEGWANSGTLSEFKSFADGGASMLFVTETAGGNIDQFKMNFATGEITRLTYDDDWDEDGAIAPDGSSIVCASWRTMHRLDALSLFPLTQTFMNLFVGSAIAIHYVSSQAGFACDLQPWLLSAEGDTERKLMGQPLAPYTGGKIFTANNIAGLPFWSPDSTKILLQERMFEQPAPGANDYVLQKGPAPNRLLLASIDRPAADPMPTVVTEIGDWALTPGEYRGSTDFQGTHTLYGLEGGMVTLTIDGSLINGRFQAEYSAFSNDGIYFLNGTEIVEGSASRKMIWTQDLTATDSYGKNMGGVKGQLTFTMKEKVEAGQPPSILTGTISSSWNGTTRSGLPGLGENPASLPKASPLALRIETIEDCNELIITAYVTANVYGDIRPVEGAKITINGQTGKTGNDGRVQIRALASPGQSISVIAEAGDTFIPAATAINR